MKKKTKTHERIFKYLFFTLFITYIALYFSGTTGYYDYSNYKKTVLTNEKIKQFEQDVKEGKELNLENYLESTSKDYNNKTSSLGLNVSKKIGDGANVAIDYIFKFLNKMFEE
ncbi:MAG: hypothetical protein IJ134_01560 [Bacilli bacterium]|nr:hypothetical protein [Bacilli bacterium]